MQLIFRSRIKGFFLGNKEFCDCFIVQIWIENFIHFLKDAPCLAKIILVSANPPVCCGRKDFKSSSLPAKCPADIGQAFIIIPKKRKINRHRRHHRVFDSVPIRYCGLREMFYKTRKFRTIGGLKSDSTLYMPTDLATDIPTDIPTDLATDNITD